MKKTFFFLLALTSAFVLGYYIGKEVIKAKIPEFQENYEY